VRAFFGWSMQALFELLAGLLVEGFREFQQWWSNRARLRAATAAQTPDLSLARSPAPQADVEPLVAELLAWHASRHVGVAVVVVRGEHSWFVGSGTTGLGRPSPPLADTIFEIGSVTKVFTATLLAALVEDGTVSLEDPVQEYLPSSVELPTRGRGSPSPISPPTRPGFPACRAASWCARSDTGAIPMAGSPSMTSMPDYPSRGCAGSRAADRATPTLATGCSGTCSPRGPAAATSS
jgi:hypothetical protein